MFVFSNKQNGMTLVEAIIYVALFTVIMFALTTTVANLYRFNAYSLAQAYQVQNARQGVETLIRDIREMTYGDDGAYPLVVFSVHELAFYSDVDRDDSVEYVTYELVASTTLTKRIYNPTSTATSSVVYNLSSPDETLILSEYVQNLIMGSSSFRYFGGNGNPVTATSSVTDVRFIQVDIVVNIDPIRNPGQFRLRSSATPRNLKDNL